MRLIGLAGNARAGKSYAAAVIRDEILRTRPEKKVGLFAFGTVLKRICARLVDIDPDDALTDDAKTRRVHLVHASDAVLCECVEILCGRRYAAGARAPEFGGVMTHEKILSGLRAGIFAITVPFNEGMRAFAGVDGETFGRVLQLVGTDVMRRNICADVFINYLRAEIRRSGVDVAIVQDVRFPNEAALIRACRGEVVGVVADFVVCDGRDAKHISENALAMSEFTVIKNNFTSEFDEAVRRLFLSCK